MKSVSTPTTTSTATSTSTATFTPTATATATATHTNTATPTHTATSTDTATATATATASPTATVTQTPLPVVMNTTITYTYDPLNRLIAASYSTGEQFGYTYDAAGNCLTQSTLAGTTTYTYNPANQLDTALKPGETTVWHYDYDHAGRLTEITPDGVAGSGARRYTYNTAGLLVRAEAHDGTAYQRQAEMVYNGLGVRVQMTGWAEGLSLTTSYTPDLASASANPLAADADGDITFYLYVRDRAVAETITSWSFYLYDGWAVPRQMVNAIGMVTYGRSYTPWGEVMLQSGMGNFTWGYFGGLMDAATGLLYVGNGQYYDPATGRFLTPANQKSPNPYLPMHFDPLGALLGPVALIAWWRGRKRGKHDKADAWMVLMVVVLVLGVSQLACKEGSGPSPSACPVPSSTTSGKTDSSDGDSSGQKTREPGSTATPTTTPTVEPTETPTLTPTPVPSAGTAYITIDDGPGAYTNEVLNVLDKKSVKATFFLLGKNINQATRNEVESMKNKGHGIGIHSWDHDWTKGAYDQLLQIQRTSNAIQEITGVAPELFRAPGGSATDADTSSYYNYSDWTTDSYDWKVSELGGSYEDAVKNVFEGVTDKNILPSEEDRAFTQNVRSIGPIGKTRWKYPIILVHSIHSIDPQAIEGIIQGLIDRGYGFDVLPNRPGDSKGAPIKYLK